ncbi:MAG: S41 family peptidase [Armatimonadetes bacterium]|nr:S41 family peptidase [Armatimonadota bacterium]MDE2207382.1 S41 family peptidase [Armatimonadota bacterium]
MSQPESSRVQTRGRSWRGGALLAVPGAALLLGFSILSGYASSNWHSNAGGAPIRLASRNDRDLATTKSADPAVSYAGDQVTPDDPVQNYETALRLLAKYHYGTVIDAKQKRLLTYAAIRGMLASLKDMFTTFLDPSEWGQMTITTQGDFEGIGAMLQQDGPNTMVAEPIQGGPAEKAGIKANDIIAKVDGVPAIGKNIDDVVKLIKGPKGTIVHLTILRDKKQLPFDITRALVEPPVVQYWMEDPKAKIGHLALSEFNEKSMQQMDVAFRALDAQGMRGLVFDVRGNPGGLLDVALQVASVFIRGRMHAAYHNAVISIRDAAGNVQYEKLVDPDPLYHPMPLVVLANGSSASAAEIVTAAIKDYGAGTVVGERTYGKGEVQTLFPMDDGSALRLTTQLYFPPSGYDLSFTHDNDGNKVPGTGGVLPNVAVTQPAGWKGVTDKTHDLQLDKALQILRARLAGNVAPGPAN